MNRITTKGSRHQQNPRLLQPPRSPIHTRRPRRIQIFRPCRHIINTGIRRRNTQQIQQIRTSVSPSKFYQIIDFRVRAKSTNTSQGGPNTVARNNSGHHQEQISGIGRKVHPLYHKHRLPRKFSINNTNYSSHTTSRHTGGGTPRPTSHYRFRSGFLQKSQTARPDQISILPTAHQVPRNEYVTVVTEPSRHPSHTRQPVVTVITEGYQLVNTFTVSVGHSTSAAQQEVQQFNEPHSQPQ